ncbi:MAG: hypothetical protein JNL38_07765, partial [Myxococcales bacterium]|nr:hypothetical protein [Myxococcales bacterium]
AAEDPGVLLEQLTKDVESLSTDDCAAACKALESMGRAAERICTLEPGVRCDDARAKVSGARSKVRAACPACAVAAATEPSHKAPSPPSPRDAPATGDTVVTESRERRGGGCAGCSASGTGSDLAGGIGTLALALFALGRARRRR